MRKIVIIITKKIVFHLFYFSNIFFVCQLFWLFFLYLYNRTMIKELTITINPEDESDDSKDEDLKEE